MESDRHDYVPLESKDLFKEAKLTSILPFSTLLISLGSILSLYRCPINSGWWDYLHFYFLQNASINHCILIFFSGEICSGTRYLFHFLTSSYTILSVCYFYSSVMSCHAHIASLRDNGLTFSMIRFWGLDLLLWTNSGRWVTQKFI